MDLYLGTPSYIWDSLIDSAENYLYNECIGQYVLGLYPFGERLYGSLRSPDELLCIYLESAEEVLDPFYTHSSFSITTSSLLVNKIHFIGLRELIKTSNSPSLVHYVVSKHLPFREELLNEILNCISKLVDAIGLKPTESDSFIETKIKSIFNTGQLCFNYKEEIKDYNLSKIDKAIMCCDNKSCKVSFQNIKFFKEVAYEKYKERKINKEVVNLIIKQLTKEYIKFYKFFI